MTNKETYNLAIGYLEKNFGRGSYSPQDALNLAYFLQAGLAYFLQEGLGGKDGIE
jgi:hypothetical protein